MRGNAKLGLCIVAACLAVAASAFAGLRSYPQVSVNTTTRTASGALSTARNTIGNQYIGCLVSGGTDWNLSVLCTAIDPAGDVGYCTSDTIRAVQTLSSMNGDSKLTFRWNTAHECTYLQVSTSSEYEPKAL